MTDMVGKTCATWSTSRLFEIKTRLYSTYRYADAYVDRNWLEWSKRNTRSKHRYIACNSIWYALRVRTS